MRIKILLMNIFLFSQYSYASALNVKCYEDALKVTFGRSKEDMLRAVNLCTSIVEKYDTVLSCYQSALVLTGKNQAEDRDKAAALCLGNRDKEPESLECYKKAIKFTGNFTQDSKEIAVLLCSKKAKDYFFDLRVRAVSPYAK